MSVRFILGRSGTGKTRLCIDEIVSCLLEETSEPNLILLVPEQASYQAERAILASGIAGYSRLHVLSFARLEFMLLGGAARSAELSSIGQQLLVHRILKQKSKELKIFGSSAGQAGMAAALAKTIIELHQGELGPESLKEACCRIEKNSPNSISAMKFADIALVYEEYLKNVESSFVNPNSRLSAACRAAADSQLVKGARLWVDGFSSFTAQEMGMLKELIKGAGQASIALCLDPARIDLDKPGQLDGMSMFSPTEETYAKLYEIARKNKIKIDEPVILKEVHRFKESPALGHIEKNFAEYEPGERPAAGKSVKIAAAANPRAEVNHAARQIRRLVKENGWRYRDIAVVASELGLYSHYIQAALSDYQIPFFIDSVKPAGQHAIVEFLSSALSAAVSGYKTREIIAYLKTDLAGLERGETDILENYCLAYGVEGDEHWLSEEPWEFDLTGKCKFEQAKIDEIRRRAVAKLDVFVKNLSGSKAHTAGQYRDEITRFFNDVEVPAKIESWIEQAGSEVEADEHRQFVKLFVELLDEMAAIFEDDLMTVGEYLGLLSRAFEQIKLRLIPPGIDQVLVGSIERSRHPDLKAIFLLGATQKQFPAGLHNDSILSDYDRAAANECGCELGKGTQGQLEQRQYLAYIAFTRASHLLHVSYPVNDHEGKAAGASGFVRSLQELFCDVEIESVSSGQAGGGEFAYAGELTEHVCRVLGAEGSGDEGGIIAGVRELIKAESGFEKCAAVIEGALGYENRAEIDAKTAAEFLGREIVSSITRLGTFASCPYQYFVKYMLRLEEREIFSFEAPDLGDFYHACLKRVYEKMRGLKIHWAIAGEEELLKLAGEAAQDELSENKMFSSFMSRSLHNQYIITCGVDVLKDFVLDLAKLARAGVFRQVGAEVPFGFGSKGVGACTVKIDEGRSISVRGIIDRIDISEDGTTAIVYDYKSSDKRPDWSKFFYGLDLQLLMYMRAIDGKDIGGNRSVRAAGAFFVPIDVGTESGCIDDIDVPGKFARKAKGVFNLGHYKMLDCQACAPGSEFYNFGIGKDGLPNRYATSGALTGEDFEAVMKFVDRIVADIGKRMLGGELGIRPYRMGNVSPCGYCVHRAVCRFDWHINEYEPLARLSKTEALASMRELLNGR